MRENIQMLKNDNNFCFSFCWVFICPGLAEAGGAVCGQLREVFEVKHRTVSLE